MSKYIYVKKQRYYLYDEYLSYEQALKVAKMKKRKTRTKYFILPFDQGWLFPEKRYKLYFNKVMRLWG